MTGRVLLQCNTITPRLGCCRCSAPHWRGSWTKMASRVTSHTIQCCGGLGRFMFHILLFNNQRAPRNNICRQSRLTLPPASLCQPGPRLPSSQHKGSWPLCTKRGFGPWWKGEPQILRVRVQDEISTLLPGNGLIYVIRSKVNHRWKQRLWLEMEYKHY